MGGEGVWRRIGGGGGVAAFSEIAGSAAAGVYVFGAGDGYFGCIGGGEEVGLGFDVLKGEKGAGARFSGTLAVKK